MPRRRRTMTTKRARPKLPDGDEGQNLSAEDKRKKLDVFLEDYDSHMERIIDELHKITKAHCNAIDSMEKMDMIALPKNVLDMKLTDFLKVGNVQAASIIAAGSMLEHEENEVEVATKCKTVKRPVRQRKNFESIAEEDEDNGSTLKPRRTTRRTTTRGKPGIKKENMPPPPTTEIRAGRTNRRAPMMPTSQTYCDTPLVTPRFDPRLVNTPGFTRNTRVKEKTLCVTVSENGSPVKDDSTHMILNDNQFYLVNENGEKQLVKVQDRATKQRLEEMKQFVRSLAAPKGD